MPRKETPDDTPKPPQKRARPPRSRSVALLAMPSAMLLGVGLTSPLAQAEPLPDNPFQDGPCVEMPDPAEARAAEERRAAEEAAEEAPEPDPAEEAASRPDEEGQADPADQRDAAGPSPDPAASDGPEPEQRRTPDPEPATEPDAAAASEPEAEETEEGDVPAGEQSAKERHPLDPLGVGDALRGIGQGVVDLLTPQRDQSEPEPEPEPEEPEPAPEPEPEDVAPEPDPGPERRESGQRQPDEGGAERSADGGGAAADGPDETVQQREEPSAAEDAAAEDAEDAEDPFAPDEDGKVPFPCPERNDVAGTDEQTAQVIPNAPWFLDASYLTLRGLKYHGVVNISTQDGTRKQALKFTADRLDIGDLHQIVDADNGLRHHVQAADGSNSTFRDGQVTMYTERLEGKLFGLIPVTFDPQHEPPLDIPIAHFTDVYVTQAAQFGGTLTIPGMQQYMTRR